MNLAEVWSGRRVLLTGHTGFKGAWLTLYLSRLGSRVTGFARAAEPGSMFEALALNELCAHREGEVTDLAALDAALEAADPEVVIHFAAQSLVREGYAAPVETFESNVMGSVKLLDAIRRRGRPCAVLMVTSDKCYAQRAGAYAFREDDAMGGDDPYSASKGAAELVVHAYRESFFLPARAAEHGVYIASARAGNVIGGGDHARHRIVPDLVRARARGEPVTLRSPNAVRPWQHVLDPLTGYLALASALLGRHRLSPEAASQGWNFGPLPTQCHTVLDLVSAFAAPFDGLSWSVESAQPSMPEAQQLRLSIDKTVSRLGWRPQWHFEETVGRTAQWYEAAAQGASPQALRGLSFAQIDDMITTVMSEAL